ncbi:MAG TPA: ABC transporter ATP-binding protein [Acetobacteraceae bacterium]|nr:ABC transporter ATP-binding protein [Acetobacteraceae bacterium]
MPISAPEPAKRETLLVARGIVAGYGKLSVLEGVDIEVRAGEAVALLGPNGAGKSTLLSALSGIIAKSAGSVHFAGADVTRATPQQAVRAGLVHVLEGHHVFGPLSVHDNLLLAAFNAPPGERAARIEEAYEAFPEMAERRHLRASALSGGQQQMLVVAQGIVRRPRLLMLDEPSAGLSPVLVDRVLAVAAAMRARGVSILLVEQLVEKALGLADRVYVLARGRMALVSESAAGLAPAAIERAYLGGEALAGVQP